jgi:hypothetical protein
VKDKARVRIKDIVKLKDRLRSRPRAMLMWGFMGQRGG